MTRSSEDGRRPRVVIVGAGFAGLSVAKRLARAPVDITLIDRENHHLFQALLYQVATAGLSPADIAWPIRRLVRDQRNMRVLLGAVTGVDCVQKRVIIGYDVLVLATGATHGYFGNDSWAAHAPGLKTIDDATEIRRRLLIAFECAEMESDARERERLLTIVIVGGGPTGVTLGDENVPAGTVIWAAGIVASPAVNWLAVAGDQVGRVLVGPDLRPPGMDDVFVIGDTALVQDVAGKPLPGIAPVAKQQGAYVAKSIKAHLAGKTALPPFRYRDRGLLATGGRKTAVIAFGRLQLKGWFAWWLWGIAHVYFLISVRNRLIVVTQWLWSYVSYERGARLITGVRAKSRFFD